MCSGPVPQHPPRTCAPSLIQRLAASTTDHADLVVLGDSRMMAEVDPLQAAGLEYRLLTIGGASSIEEYFQLRDYLDVNRPPRAIVMSFAPYHLSEAYAFWSRALRYSFLTLEDYREVIDTAHEVGG